MSPKDIAASLRAKLLNHARKTNQDFNLVLTRFCLERLLYRVSISEYKDQFLLKGALLFDLWFDIPHRPTRDADLLGFGSSEIPDIERVFKEICATEVDDGVEFLDTTVSAEEIRKEANYSGVRVTLQASLSGAISHLQIDIGFGDAVTPAPEEAVYPVILDELEQPKLSVYPKYTVVAEKLEALTSLGIANSRLKDYFDLWILARQTEFDGETLRQAISATFACRKTKLPEARPLGLTAEFAEDPQKQTQWNAFIRKNALDAIPLEEVVKFLDGFLLAPMAAARDDQAFEKAWSPNGPWTPKKIS